MNLGRRDFLRAVAGAAAASVLPSRALAQTQNFPLVLWARRGPDVVKVDCATLEGWQAVCWILRDVRAGEVGQPHPALIQLHCWMQAWLAAYGVHTPFEYTSGLRMPWTNVNTEGSARSSQHLPDERRVFRAADLTTPAVSAEYLGRLAAQAGQGGVGFYSDRGFVHTDVGRIRYWRTSRRV